MSVSVSLDGFSTGPEVSVDQPMGAGGERLHEWLFADDMDRIDAEVARERRAASGAVLIGRRMFELGVGPWGDTPFAMPCFVVTHRARTDLPMASGTFVFVTDGIERALQLAREAAGERDVQILGGADIQQQYLRAGLVDEIDLQLVPVLLGAGTRLFDKLAIDPIAPIELERVRLAGTPHVTHMRLGVRRR